MTDYDRHSCVKVGKLLLTETKNGDIVEDRKTNDDDGCNGESEHRCRFCNYSSPYKGNLRRHLQLVHKLESEDH
uniref:C2H2-type domain-containing protein n=1 Tax=Plectus sambesii TaxID=2011161 RepID=A0A914V4K0_9BILA